VRPPLLDLDDDPYTLTEQYEDLDEAVRHVRTWPWPGDPQVAHSGGRVVVVWPAKYWPWRFDKVLALDPLGLLVHRAQGCREFMLAALRYAHNLTINPMAYR